jgi:hypothetical protein
MDCFVRSRGAPGTEALREDDDLREEHWSYPDAFRRDDREQADARSFVEASDGLEPSTPSLPWQPVATHGNGFRRFGPFLESSHLRLVATGCARSAP